MKPTRWRDALRDSDLDRTAKLVGFVLSTYMSGKGKAWPAKITIARGAGLGRPEQKGNTAVDNAVDRLEAAGFLDVERRRGRGGFSYQAAIPRALRDSIPRGDEGKESPAETAQIPRRGEGESAESVDLSRAAPTARRPRRKRARLEAALRTPLEEYDR